jgi:hypothetical protein
MELTLSCFDEIMRLSPDGSSVHGDMDIRDDDGMEVSDNDGENDSDHLLTGPITTLGAMDARESKEKMGCTEPCNIYLSASTTKR